MITQNVTPQAVHRNVKYKNRLQNFNPGLTLLNRPYINENLITLQLQTFASRHLRNDRFILSTFFLHFPKSRLF